MKQVRGNSLTELSSEDLEKLISSYTKVHVDIGTGDGRFVYKHALKDSQTLYIGVDPSHTQLERYSKRAQRDKVTNSLFVIGSIEIFPPELIGIADRVTVILPWGTLLQSIVLGKKDEISTIFSTLKDEGTLEILFGYSIDAEPSETKRLDLDDLDYEYVRDRVLPKFLEYGFSEGTVSPFNQEGLNNFESTWSKKLTFGQQRPLFYLKLKKSPVAIYLEKPTTPTI